MTSGAQRVMTALIMLGVSVWLTESERRAANAMIHSFASAEIRRYEMCCRSLDQHVRSHRRCKRLLCPEAEAIRHIYYPHAS